MKSNLTKLNRIRKSIPPDVWKTRASTNIYVYGYMFVLPTHKINQHEFKVTN